MSLILDAIEFVQNGKKMYLAAVPIGDLEACSMDIWDPRNVVGRQGYQRNPDVKRIAKIARYCERPDALMPIAGLLNVREAKALSYNNGRLKIPDGVKIWVVDMQHRLKGLIKAREDGALRDKSFRFPVVITSGLSQIQEAAQFYVINTRAKKMDVALTRRLLIENGAIRDMADARPWEIAAVQITIALNSSGELRDNPWWGVIRQPNEERMKAHVATEKSFVSCLKKVILQEGAHRPRRLGKRLANLWRAIRDVIPEPFEDPRRHLIQKTSGMFAINYFLAPKLLDRYSDTQFRAKVAGLAEMGNGFWRRRNHGGARRFGSGMAGYENLARHVGKFIGVELPG